MYEELDVLLTENEKTVYIALLQLGEKTASPILEKTGLQNSVFYRTIHRLMEKGYVGYVLKGKIKHFRALSPDNFLNNLKEKERKIKNILPELKDIQKISEAKVESEVFVGIKGIKTVFYELIEDAKPKDKYCFFSMKPEHYQEAMEKVFLQFRAHRLQKKIDVYGIHPNKLRGNIEAPTYSSNRYTDFPLPPNMAIFKDKVLITTWGETPTGILIKGKEIADQYRDLFEKIWEISED